ncbi:MAG: hypothetical protein C4345_05680 [Chloroflexota bacterium]
MSVNKIGEHRRVVSVGILIGPKDVTAGGVGADAVLDKSALWLWWQSASPLLPVSPGQCVPEDLAWI